MEPRLKKFLKRYWIVLWIAVISTVLLSLAAFAAYTKTNRAKSVVAKYGTVNSRFSSNYLEEVSMEKPVYVTSTDGKYGDTVLISNYAQTNPAFHYDTVINYKLEMKLGYMNGNTFVPIDENTSAENFVLGERYITATITGNNGYSNTIKFGYDNGNPIKYSETILKDNSDNYLLSLPGTTSISDSIALEFSENQKTSLFAETPTFDKKLYLEMKATPDPLQNYTGLTEISARICLSKSAKVESITWTGNFNEAGSDVSVGAAPHNISTPLDGFNYVIQGMGSGWAELKWKPAYVEISEQFLIEELGIQTQNLPTESNGYKTVRFQVDSNTQKNRYDVQIYRSGLQQDAAYSTWEQMNSYVEFTFPADAP